jgi:hypothetical protein
MNIRKISLGDDIIDDEELIEYSNYGDAKEMQLSQNQKKKLVNYAK